mmetsp:Transcript_26734/g.58115  ORF Transcript_26734/g.58115 Transcript_26734/m.58115 type:complete len:276 (+) Transcript_26734:781-1608(+)
MRTMAICRDIEAVAWKLEGTAALRSVDLLDITRFVLAAIPSAHSERCDTVGEESALLVAESLEHLLGVIADVAIIHRLFRNQILASGCRGEGGGCGGGTQVLGERFERTMGRRRGVIAIPTSNFELCRSLGSSCLEAAELGLLFAAGCRGGSMGVLAFGEQRALLVADPQVQLFVGEAGSRRVGAGAVGTDVVASAGNFAAEFAVAVVKALAGLLERVLETEFGHLGQIVARIVVAATPGALSIRPFPVGEEGALLVAQSLEQLLLHVAHIAIIP